MYHIIISILILFIIILIIEAVSWYFEDKRIEADIKHYGAYIKNKVRPKTLCLEAKGRALDDAVFYNSIARIYLDADLMEDFYQYAYMSRGILVGLTNYPYMSRRILVDLTNNRCLKGE